MRPAAELPASMEWRLTFLRHVSRHGYSVTGFMFFHHFLKALLEAYLGSKSEGLGFREMVDLVEADGNRFENKADLMRRLRVLDERVTSAWNEQGPGAWERANRALEPHVEESVALARHVLPCLFDFSRWEERGEGKETPKG